MVIREDTLSREVEILVAALLRLRRFGYEPDEMIEKIDHLLRTEGGVPTMLLRALDAQGLLAALSLADHLDVARALAVGILLIERAKSSGLRRDHERGMVALRAAIAKSTSVQRKLVRERLPEFIELLPEESDEDFMPPTQH